MDTSSQTTIIFHHIPKTAGTTLLNIVPKLYEKDGLYVIDGIETDRDVEIFKSMTLAQKSKYPVIIGHQAIMLYDHIVGEKKVVSFFREPFSQFVSDYYYLRKATHNLKHHKYVKKMSLTQFLDYTIENNINNPQSKVLFVPHYEDVSDENEIFEGARKGFSKVDFPCITEDFDLSLMLLRRELGWRSWPFYTFKNRSDKKGYSFDEDVFIKHREFNKSDYEIYAKAKEVFSGKVSEQDRKQSEKFKIMNSCYRTLKRFKVI